MLASGLNKLAEVVVSKHDVNLANISPGYQRNAYEERPHRSPELDVFRRLILGLRPALRAGKCRFHEMSLAEWWREQIGLIL